MEDSIEETKKTFFVSRSQIEEAKKIEAYLTIQLQAKKEICQRKELEILSLKGDLDKIVSQLKTNSRREKSIDESEISNIPNKEIEENLTNQIQEKK